jgi:hypothetical protein
MNVEAAAVGGLIGGAAMVVVLYLMIWMFPQQMKMYLLLLVGTMFVPAGAAAYAVGLMMHAMMSVVFGLTHGALLAAFDVESVGLGIGLGVLFGLGHAVISGAMLGLMPLVHPRMRPAQPKLVPAMAGLSPGPNEQLLDPPGFFGLNYPPLTVVGFFMLHIMFGLIVGAVYGASA